MSDVGFRGAAIGAAVVVGIALFFLRFCGTESMPPLPPVPETTLAQAKQTSLDIGERSDVYSRQVEDDSRRYDVVSKNALDSLSKVFPHRSDRTVRTLASGDSVETLGLRLAATVRDVGKRSRQLELVIENRSAVTLAYRVVTRPTRGTSGCMKKEAQRHNAIVLAPGEVARRSECVYRKGLALEIGKVEIMEVPELSYHYLSAMPPSELGLEKRTAHGHKLPEGVPRCRTVLPARVRRGLEAGQVLWRDLVDFFARHNCEKYRFPNDYRAFGGDEDLILPFPGSVR